MSHPPNDSNILSDSPDSHGWYKLILPDILTIMGSLWSNPEDPQVELLPFIYAKLDPEQTAFDITLSQPMYALDRVCLVQIDRAPKSGSKIIPVVIIGLAAISSEQEGRCYIPTYAVSCIIPVKPDHPLVDTLIKASTESLVVTPSIYETGTILNLPNKD